MQHIFIFVMIGSLIHFKSNTSNITQQEEILPKLNQRKCKMGKNDWKNYHMPEICLMIDIWDLEELQPKSTTGQVIHELTCINFPFLKILNLQRNRIRSVEGLRCIKMPALQDIYLGSNFLCSIRCLRFCIWPNLQNLYLSDNAIRDWQLIPQLLTENLSWITITTSEYFDQNQCDSMQWCMKLPLKPKKFKLSHKRMNLIKNTTVAKLTNLLWNFEVILRTRNETVILYDDSESD